jgi:hypothetical protein
MMCHTIPSTTGGTVTLPFAFVAHTNPSCTIEQQHTMEKAIICMDDMCTTLTATSIAEQALQQASGTKTPIKCFGCEGIQEYEKDSYHLWRNCPRKGDPRVFQNFQTNLQKFRERRQERRYDANRYDGNRYGKRTMHTAPRDWAQDGYPSKETQEHITTIADPNTLSGVRKSSFGNAR